MHTLEKDMLEELVDTPGLIEYLFPDKSLPLPSSELIDIIFTSMKFFELADAYISSETCATSPLTWDAKEMKLSTFLNNIGDELAEICAERNAQLKSPRRRWHSKDLAVGLMASGLPGCEDQEGNKSNRQNRELILIEDDMASATCNWSDVLVHGEMHNNSKSFLKTASQCLANNAEAVFSSQDGRSFHIGVSFTVYDIRLHVFDRAGLVGSRSFNLHDQPVKFVHCVAGLMLGELSALGFDPSITHTPEGSRFITVDKKEYGLLEAVFISDDIWGRGTVCWRGRHEGVDYAIKDVWALVRPDQDHTEADILRRARGVEGVAQIVADEVVQIDGKDDSTDRIRSIPSTKKNSRVSKWLETLEVRVHRRIVTTPFARELSHFSSKKELLSVFIDAIKAHRGLVEKRILHRDISYGNIMIYKPPENVAETREFNKKPAKLSLKKGKRAKVTDTQIQKGLLIDLDFATFMDEEREGGGDRQPIGTTAFIAVELLMRLRGEDTKHEPRHDLESFFYVLLWICWNYSGPNNTPREDFDIVQSALEGIILGHRDKATGFRKHRYMTNRLCDYLLFQTAILNNFAPYFEDLKPCVKRLWQKIFTVPPNSGSVSADISHQDVIDILEQTRRALPDKERGSKGGCQKDVSTRKRRREADPGSDSDGAGGQRRKLRARPVVYMVSEEI